MKIILAFLIFWVYNKGRSKGKGQAVTACKGKKV